MNTFAFMIRTLTLTFALPLVLSLSAQHRAHDQRSCAAHTFTQRLLQEQGLSTDLLHALPAPSGAQRGGNFTIPVVVHVVYNNAAENIPSNTILALIDELNQDYSATNSDISGVRATFTNSIGATNFQFCLAQVDPNGNATTGITRTPTTDTWFDPDTQTNAMKSAPLGRAPWDTERYLNIWICDITSGATGGTVTVGYAYLPTGGVVGSDIDGLVIDYDYGTQPGDRTATHEIGHYFGLLHPFDENGNCVNADGFSDTPTTNSPTYACTNTNLIRCGVLTQYENFMDYASCSVMFTDQQAAYMTDVLTGVRSNLLLNPACSGPVTGICIPTSQAGTSEGDFINRVALGTINNANSGGVGEPTYTDFSGTFSTTLDRGVQYTITIQGGSYQPDNYAAWVDYDQDETFEASEKLGEFATTAINQTQSFTFTVPAGAALGSTVLRVRGVFHNQGEPVPTDPCFDYDYGETEDYGITIATVAVGPCIPTSVNGTVEGDFINSVILEGIQNTNSGGSTAPAYTDFSATFSTNLARNGLYGVVVQGGTFQPDNYAVWIDYDQDDLFEAAEKLGEFATTAVNQSQIISFTVPAVAVLGNTTMRVRGVYFNTNEPTPVNPCFAYAFGETEDYRITITPPLTGYCIPTSINGTADGDFINGVQLSDINNINSGGTSAPTYSNLSATAVTNLVRGSAQSISIQGGSYAPDAYAAWIDYDQDQTFEATEKLGEFTTTVAGQTRSINFTVPNNATLGSTRMRVRGVFLAAGEPTPTNPCFSYGYGETEDYGIIIETSTSLHSIATPAFGIYPNPTTGLVALELPSSHATNVELIDLQGRLVVAQQFNAERVILDLSSVAAGSYLVRIHWEGHSAARRLEVIDPVR